MNPDSVPGLIQRFDLRFPVEPSSAAAASRDGTTALLGAGVSGVQ